MKQNYKFNALVIFFYDYPEYIGYGYTLGKTTFAPDGEWAKATEVETGEYDKMSFDYQLRKKDWDKQLTPEEVEVWSAWQKLYEEKDEETGLSQLPYEEKITNAVAEKFDITPEEVSKILTKKSIWDIMDED